MNRLALLVLEDGTQFIGRAIGIVGSAVGEVIFNTSMTGYQEILTDPSYFRQIIIFTYPHIGNVGINSDDEESSQVYAQGVIIRDLSPVASNFRSTEELSSYLKRKNVIAMSDIDTRKLTRLLREKGTQNGCIITDNNLDARLALKKAKNFPKLDNLDLVKEVTTSKIYDWNQGSWILANNALKTKKKVKLPFKVVVYDYGTKRNILRILVDFGCQLTIVPAKTPVDEVLKMKPDGIFLSNGPGNPGLCDYAINAIKVYIEIGIPIFGICMGHQLLALASGAKIIKMKFGHHGSNHPVKDLNNNVVMITTQNHNFTVDETSLPMNLRITHKSLFDGSIQGIHRTDKPAFSFQGHPEASPGPCDAIMLFNHFVDLIKQYRDIKLSGA